MPNQQAVIDVYDVTKSFGGKRAVDGVSLTINQGEVFGFLGPNGSGKTTFLRILCGLIVADEGYGHCLGVALGNASEEVKGSVGYMTQRFSLYEDLSVQENLEFTARIYGLVGCREQVEETLKRHGLEEIRSHLAGHLSGGWKQRLALAGAMIHRPKLLVLDEPTAGVDPRARQEFWGRIHGSAAEGVTVLVSTHYMDEAERCHRIGYMSNGRLAVQGSSDEIIGKAALTTWKLRGPELQRLANELRDQMESVQVIEFGDSLHLSCSETTQGTIENALAPFIEGGIRCEKVPTSLEDAFVHLTSCLKEF